MSAATSTAVNELHALVRRSGLHRLNLGAQGLCGLLGNRRLGHLRLQLRDSLVALSELCLVAEVAVCTRAA